MKDITPGPGTYQPSGIFEKNSSTILDPTRSKISQRSQRKSMETTQGTAP